MPCSDSRDYGPSEEEVKRNHLMCRLACEYMKKLESLGEPIPPHALSWWRQHQEDDQRREFEAQQMKRKAELVKQARRKLTPEEINALREGGL